MKYVIVCCLLFGLLACTNPTEVDTRCFDYSGSASWLMTSDSLMLLMSGDFIGTLAANIDSTNNVNAVMSGTITAPLMQNSFSWTGTIKLNGILKRENDDFEIIFTAPADTLELYWNKADDLIWYVGTSCK